MSAGNLHPSISFLNYRAGEESSAAEGDGDRGRYRYQRWQALCRLRAVAIANNALLACRTH